VAVAMKLRATTLALAALLSLAPKLIAQGSTSVVHVGYFPNITHSQALIGKATGKFEQALAPSAKVEWKEFNAGPSVVEALFAGALDIAYIGPNPTIAGYTRSRGAALRVIAGATSGGAALVVRPASGIKEAKDFHGKRIATPQLGNTQDVALRAWLRANGLSVREKGGDVQVIPIANPDQLTLFLKGEIDAAWAPEPWAARLVHEASGRIFLDERDLWPNRQFVAAEVIVRTDFLKQHPDLVKTWLRTHVDLTNWINKNPVEAKRILNEEIKRETNKSLPSEVLDDSFSRIEVTYDPLRQSLLHDAEQAYDLGFLGKEKPDLSGLFDLAILNEILLEKKARPIP
jgi:NitT/TauT family transport system substrate-binding protein